MTYATGDELSDSTSVSDSKPIPLALSSNRPLITRQPRIGTLTLYHLAGLRRRGSRPRDTT